MTPAMTLVPSDDRTVSALLGIPKQNPGFKLQLIHMDA